MKIRPLIAGAVITTAGVLAFGGTTSAHTLDAYCDGPTAHLGGSLYVEANYSIDGAAKVHFVGSFSQTRDGHTAHTVTVSDSSDGQGNGTKSTPICVVPETTIPATTAPATTVPPTTVPETTEPETTVPETTVPETSTTTNTLPPTTSPDETTTTVAPTTTAPSDTAAPQDACLDINPVTGIGTTALHFIGCGPGVELCLSTPGGEFIHGPNGLECKLPAVPGPSPATPGPSTTVSSSLPVTGTSENIQIGIAVAILAAGAGLVFVARRRTA